MNRKTQLLAWISRPEQDSIALSRLVLVAVVATLKIPNALVLVSEPLLLEYGLPSFFHVRQLRVFKQAGSYEPVLKTQRI